MSDDEDSELNNREGLNEAIDAAIAESDLLMAEAIESLQRNISGDEEESGADVAKKSKELQIEAETSIAKTTLTSKIVGDSLKRSDPKREQKKEKGVVGSREAETEAREGMTAAQVFKEAGLFEKYEAVLNKALSCVESLEDMFYYEEDVEEHVEKEDIPILWKQAADMSSHPLDFVE